MGQAKKRGTLDQRVEQAREKFNADIDVRKREIEELDAFEKRQFDAMQHHLNTYILPGMERKHGPLMRVDCSQLELKITQEALDKKQETQ